MGRGNLVWMLLVYLLPLIFLIGSLKRLFGLQTKRRAEPLPPAAETGEAAEAPPVRRGIRGRFTRAFIAGPLIIFFTFVIARLFAPEYIFDRGLQAAVFENVWVYVLMVVVPGSLGALVYGLWAMSQNKGQGWPVVLIFCALATLFITSVFAVILLSA